MFRFCGSSPLLYFAAASESNLPHSFALPLIFSLRFFDRLPLHVRRVVGSTFRERNDVIDDVSRSSGWIASHSHEIPLSGFTSFDSSARISRSILRYDRSEEHTSELQSPCNLVCRLLLEKKKQQVRDWIRTRWATRVHKHSTPAEV